MHADPMPNLDRFMKAYESALISAVQGHPDEYAFPPSRVPEVAARMRAAIERGTYSHDGRGFRGACKALGIRHTRKAIHAFIDGAAS